MTDNRLTAPLDALADNVAGGWHPVVQRWRQSSAGRALIDFVDSRVRAGAVVYPAQVFRALQATPLDKVRAVLLGQDPYHGPGQAEGLAFSVPTGQPLPPSLRNIFKEAQRDLGWKRLPPDGHLGPWATAGVLLLNTSLTVEDGRAGSHTRQGWEALTDDLLSTVAQQPRPVVFLLWGAHAQSRAAWLSTPGQRHLVLQSNHPSPLSATRGPQPFMGNGHFGRAQRFLNAQGASNEPLWDLPGVWGRSESVKGENV